MSWSQEKLLKPMAMSVMTVHDIVCLAGHKKPLGSGAGARRLLRRLSRCCCSRSVRCQPWQ